MIVKLKRPAVLHKTLLTQNNTIEELLISPTIDKNGNVFVKADTTALFSNVPRWLIKRLNNNETLIIINVDLYKENGKQKCRVHDIVFTDQLQPKNGRIS